jgi:hypothetical protein
VLVELIVTPIISVFIGLLNLLPAFPGYVIRDEVITWFGGVISTAAAFLPIGDLLVMLGMWLAVVNFTVIWRLIQRAWDALPFT